MQKILALLAISSLALLAEESASRNYHPLDISAITVESIDLLPSTEKVKTPLLTPLSPLQKRPAESEDHFLKRVREATKTRQDQTFALQKMYRDEVSRRNGVAGSSKVEFDEQLKRYNLKLRKFRDFLDYDAKVHGARNVSQNYPRLQDIRADFDDSLQNPNLNDAYLPLLTAYADKRYGEKEDDLIQLVKRTKKIYPDYKSWLFVVSIERYLNADRVLFASRTSEAVIKAFQKKLGVPSRHTIVLKEEKANVSGVFEELEKMVQRVQPDDTIYFYFVGHATSGPLGKNFLLAYDGSAEMLDDEGIIEMERLYNAFQRSRAGRTFAFIDASFKGVSDGIPLKKGTTAEWSAEKTRYHKRLNIINAAHRDQTANAYFEKGYRLFSYFLLKSALSEKEQDAGEMFDTLQQEIMRVSETYGVEFEQEPQFFGYRNLAMQK